jgi:hypothetical protein
MKVSHKNPPHPPSPAARRFNVSRFTFPFHFSISSSPKFVSIRDHVSRQRTTRLGTCLVAGLGSQFVSKTQPLSIIRVGLSCVFASLRLCVKALSPPPSPFRPKSMSTCPARRDSCPKKARNQVLQTARTPSSLSTLFGTPCGERFTPAASHNDIDDLIYGC